MDTQTKTSRFIILIPHRDALKPIGEYQKKLFSIGLAGACSFPMAAPLAAVSRPFSRDELKGLGRNIRASAKCSDGKISSSGTALAGFPEKFSLFGLLLDLHIEESLFNPSAKNKVLFTFSPPVLCAALLASEEKPVSEEGPFLSFRAASLANLAIRPLDRGARPYSLEWKISPPVWLPKHTKNME